MMPATNVLIYFRMDASLSIEVWTAGNPTRGSPGAVTPRLYCKARAVTSNRARELSRGPDLLTGESLDRNRQPPL
jgi:hypothetical protein